MIGIMTSTTTTGRWSSRTAATKAKDDTGMAPLVSALGGHSLFPNVTQVKGLIPRRRKTRINATPVLWQTRDRLQVLVIEPDVQRIEIGPLALGARGLRDRRYAVLVEQPFQRDLCCACPMLVADRHQRFV